MLVGSITLLIPLIQAVPATLPNSGGVPNDDRKRFPIVYRQTIVGIQIFMAIFAMTCWMSFGDDVNTVLTTSLPEGILATSVQLAYSLAVMFTFPFQHFPSLEISCRLVAMQIKSTCGRWGLNNNNMLLRWMVHRNVISSFLVCLLALVALMAMDALDRVVSLMGSLIGCPVAFIIPPLIHSQLVPNLSKERIRMNQIVSVAGAIAMVVASITTILQWSD